MSTLKGGGRERAGREIGGGRGKGMEREGKGKGKGKRR